MTTLKKQQNNVQGQADGQIQSNGTFIAMILMHTLIVVSNSPENT